LGHRGEKILIVGHRGNGERALNLAPVWFALRPAKASKAMRPLARSAS
jgi:hypothetical protein